jgi:hypothetical protein
MTFMMDRRRFKRRPGLKNTKRGTKSFFKRAWELLPTRKQVFDSFNLLVFLALAAACVLIATLNFTDVNSFFGKSSKFFHRILVTDFEQQNPDELWVKARCPALYAVATDELWGVDSVCTCLEQGMHSYMISDKNLTIATFDDNIAKRIIRECIELQGAMPSYVLTYAGTVASVEYIFWAFLCITASCVTSFTRMESYPNHHKWVRRFMVLICGGMNLFVFIHSIMIWSTNFGAFETDKHHERRHKNLNSCATIRFVFALSVLSFFFHIPHYLSHAGIWWCEYPELFIEPKKKKYVTVDATDHISFLSGQRNPKLFDKKMQNEQQEDTINFIDNGGEEDENDNHEEVSYEPNDDSWDSKWDDPNVRGSRLSSQAIRSSIYAYSLHERDEQFRISYWQAVSEDINFTMGCVLLAVTFSAHGGVHDDSTLIMDLFCVFMVGTLQHFSHVLMLVKEYLFEDQEKQMKGNIVIDEEREEVICRNIGNTRLMIHFFVLSLIVFYCNRTAPSTFQNNEVSSYFQVARFSVILGLCACNTMYDVFFETVHIIKHMTEAGRLYTIPGKEDQDRYMYRVDAAPADQKNAKRTFLDYHLQYQGPYLWRVHLVLPLLLVFGLITNGLQGLRPILKTDADVLLF